MDSLWQEHVRDTSQRLGIAKVFAPVSNKIGGTDDSINNNIYTNLKGIYNYMLDTQEEGEALLKQQIMINSIRNAVHYNSDYVSTYGIAKAMAIQKASLFTAASLATNYLVPIKIIIDLVLFASFVLLLPAWCLSNNFGMIENM